MSRITFVLAELERRTLAEIGYEIAAEYLRELRYLPIFSIHHALQTEECEMRLNRGREEEAASRTNEMLYQFNPGEINYIEELLQKYDSSLVSNRVLHLILYHKLDELNRDNCELSWIRRLARNIRVVAYDLAGEKDDTHTSIHAAIKYGAMFTERLLSRLDGIVNVEAIEMNNTRVECLFAVGNIYFRTGDYETSSEYMERGVRISRGLDNDSEETFERHCVMLWVLGNSHYRMRRFDDAAVYYAETKEELRRNHHIAEKWIKIVGRDLVKALFRFGETPINVDTILTPAPNTEEILQQIDFHRQRNTISSALFVAEAEIRLGRGEEDASLQNIWREINRSRFRTAECIRVEGDKHDTQYKDQRLPALLMYRNAFEMYIEEEHTPHDTAKWIRDLAQDVFLASSALAAEDRTSASLAITYGAMLIEDMLFYLQSIANRALRVLKFADAECVFYLANIYFRAEIYDTSSLHFETAVQLFRELYQEQIYQDKHYCLSLWNLGNCNYRMGQFREAEDWYSKTVEALRMSTASIRGDWLQIAERDFLKATEKQNRLILTQL